MMPPLATSYNTASSALSTQGVYNPSLNNTFDNQEVQIGYPSGYGHFPWDPLSTAKPQARTAQRPLFSQIPDSTHQSKKQSRRAKKASRKKLKSRLTTAALVVGGVILASLIL